MTSPSLLALEGLVVRHGRAIAVDEVSLAVGAGERVALIGPNGAGKTSLLNAVFGLARTTSGRVRVDGRDLTGRGPGTVVRAGLTQVPEGRQVFPTLPVEANLLLGAYGREFRRGILTATLRYLRRRSEISERLERVYSLLPTLRELRERPAGRTSGGEQQMVAIGRALMAAPRLLAVDELSLGLGPLVVRDLAAFLLRLNDEEGVALLLVEQNAALAFDLCTRAYVLEAGRVVLAGESDTLRRSERLRSAYLGGGVEAADGGARARE